MRLNRICMQRGHDVRVVMIDSAPWWVVNDLTVFFGTSRENMRQLMARHLDPDERSQVSLGTVRGPQPHATVSESGLNKLLMKVRARRPEVADFQNWVARTVLPAIPRLRLRRSDKDGAYVMGEEKVEHELLCDQSLIS